MTNILRDIPADSYVTVVGITDQSFAQPYMLLSAHVAADPGYFGERLASARSALLALWKARGRGLQPRFPSTDILGALALAGQIFEEHPDASRKVLVIFSDMRHHTRNLDLKSSPLNKNEKHLAIYPDLHGVEVNALGVDGANKSLEEWEALRGFWSRYIEHSGGVLKQYEALRNFVNHK